MKIGILTFDSCERCENYDSRLDCCEMDEMLIQADGEDVNCLNFKEVE